jgi:hypothetical protein
LHRSPWNNELVPLGLAGGLADPTRFQAERRSS